MTVSTTATRVTYLGNGVATQFSFNFKTIDQSQLVVELTTLATGVITVLNDSQYSVTGIGTDSGVVTYPLVGSPITSATSITIRREVPLTQDTAFSNQSTYYADVVERSFDTRVMETQQVANDVARSLRLGETDIDGSGAYQANGNRITGLGAPTQSTDAVRLSDVQGIVVAAGNVPLPIAGQTSYTLTATGTGTFGWNSNFQADTTGRTGFGAAINSAISHLFGKAITGAVAAFAARFAGIIQSDVTTVAVGVQVAPQTVAAAFTCGTYVGFDVASAVKGAGSAITVSVGYNVASGFNWGGTNIAFRGQLAAAANTWNAYMEGTAPNWFAAGLAIGGSARAPGANLDILGSGVLLGAATGGDKGEGTVNATVGYYVNGQKIGQTVPMRQTVLCGPVDGTTGLANFLPATSINLNLTTTGISASAPFVATAANACDAGGAVDRVGQSTANLTWSALTALSTCFLYVDIAADGTLTTGHTTLAPTYQQGGTRSTVNGQFTFNIGEMSATVGNGTAAVQSYRVFVGEATTNAGSVTATVAYAYLGRTVLTSAAALALSTTYNLSHNLGVIPRDIHMTYVCTSAELNYAVGSEVVPLTQPGSSFGISYGVYDRLAMLALSGSGAIGYLVNAGTATAMTVGKWSGRWYLNRGW